MPILLLAALALAFVGFREASASANTRPTTPGPVPLLGQGTDTPMPGPPFTFLAGRTYDVVLMLVGGPHSPTNAEATADLVSTGFHLFEVSQAFQGAPSFLARVGASETIHDDGHPFTNAQGYLAQITAASEVGV